MASSNHKSNLAYGLFDVDQLRADFKQERRNKGLSQSYVAARLLGITQACLSAWETGKNQSMRVDTLTKIHTLVNEWQQSHDADPNNILQMPIAARSETTANARYSHHDEPPSPRVGMENKLRAFFGDDSLVAAMLPSLNWRALLELSVLAHPDARRDGVVEKLQDFFGDNSPVTDGLSSMSWNRTLEHYVLMLEGEREKRKDD